MAARGHKDHPLNQFIPPSNGPGGSTLRERAVRTRLGPLRVAFDRLDEKTRRVLVAYLDARGDPLETAEQAGILSDNQSPYDRRRAVLRIVSKPHVRPLVEQLFIVLELDRPNLALVRARLWQIAETTGSQSELNLAVRNIVALMPKGGIVADDGTADEMAAAADRMTRAGRRAGAIDTDGQPVEPSNGETGDEANVPSPAHPDAE